MKPLVAKEIRLLLPAFVLALVLSLAPVWLFNSVGHGEESLGLAFYLLCFGGLMIALSSFGREFAMGTFPGLLALPLTRARIWWIKIGVLSCALAAIFGTYYFTATYLISLPGGRSNSLYGMGEPANFTTVATACVAIFASGLWTTLLLRQMMAAFWFALLVPAAILTVILWNGGTAATAEVVLGLYSIAGFVWAWRQFYRAQEVAWTGSEINLPDWQSSDTGVGSTGRTYRPLAALIWKEIRLYRVALLGMAGLFVLHLAVILARTTTHGGPEFSVFNTLLTMFGGIWLIVPLFTGSLNVADERRLGTMEGQLCLPVSTRKQFAIKLLVVLLLSGCLSFFLLGLAEWIGSAVHSEGGVGGIKISLHGEGLSTLYLLAVFLGLSLWVFYASTLSRSILQTIVTAVSMGVALEFVCSVAGGMRMFLEFWDGPLLSVIIWPTMIAAIIALSYRNYCRLSGTWLLWLRNVRGLILAVLFAVTIAALIFNRTWELLTPVEPSHGPAQRGISQSTAFRSDGRGVSLILPDGRLWSERVIRVSRGFIQSGDNIEFVYGDNQWVGQKGNHYLEGSNWLAFTDHHGEIMGIRSDGTLWASEKPDSPLLTGKGQWQLRPQSKLVQQGAATDWKNVVGNENYVVLLKKDGTLWRPGHQLGTDTDWSDIISSSMGTFLWKSDGRAWKFDFHTRKPEGMQIVLESGYALKRWEIFDNVKWRSLTGAGRFSLGVRDDGTLWTFGGPPANSTIFDENSQNQPLQVGTASNWVSVAGNYQTLVALKADGTLWKWQLNPQSPGSGWPLNRPPTRLGTHSDWVALAGNTSLTSLAADGSIWHWPEAGYGDWLGPSRKPVKFDTIITRP